MSTRTWLGAQQATAQVGTFTVTGYDATTTYTITIGGVAVSVLGSGGTTTTVATALAAALAASTVGQFTEIIWTSNAAVITATANTAGVPFTAASSVTGGAGTIGSYTAVTANTSPNDLDDAANWSGGTLPINADTVVFDETSTVPVYWNLGALSAITPAKLIITAGYTGTIGLFETAPTAPGQGTYPEYRQPAMEFTSQSGSTYSVGQGQGNGSGLLRLQLLGSAQVWTGNVYSTGSSTETGRQALSIWGGTDAMVINHWGGSLGLAELQSQTLTVATINCGSGNQGAQTPNLIVGPGVTLTTLIASGAGTQYQLLVAATTVTHKNGVGQISGAGAIGTLAIGAGQVYDLGTGAIATASVGANATLDMGSAGSGVTITNVLLLYFGATFNDPSFRTTLTAGFEVVGCALPDVTVNQGPTRTYAVT